MAKTEPGNPRNLETESYVITLGERDPKSRLPVYEDGQEPDPRHHFTDEEDVANQRTFRPSSDVAMGIPVGGRGDEDREQASRKAREAADAWANPSAEDTVPGVQPAEPEPSDTTEGSTGGSPFANAEAWCLAKEAADKEEKANAGRKSTPDAGGKASAAAPKPADEKGVIPGADVATEGDKTVVVFKNPTDKPVAFHWAIGDRSNTRTVAAKSEATGKYESPGANEFVEIRLGDENGDLVASTRT